MNREIVKEKLEDLELIAEKVLMLVKGLDAQVTGCGYDRELERRFSVQVQVARDYILEVKRKSRSLIDDIEFCD